MFKTTCCGGSAVQEMEKQDKETQEKVEKVEQAIVMEMMPPPPPTPPPPPPPPGYKLSYFDTRIGGEMIRLLFHKAEVPFEDNRIQDAEWESMKSAVQWGKLPILEFEGNTIYSSTAISRFLAKRFNLCGADEIESAKCDEMVEVCQDIRTAWGTYFYGTSADSLDQEAKLKEHLQKIMATNLPKYEDIIAKNGGTWLVGGGCTWADIFVANFLSVYEETIDPAVLEGFPALNAMKKAVFAFPEIQKYVESRAEK